MCIRDRALTDANINPITIDYKDKQAILRRVADFMQQNKEGLAGNLIDENNLENIIKDYLKSVDINVDVRFVGGLHIAHTHLHQTLAFV